jgi:AbrB family looped-hinge helix DNA binding protein
MNSSYSITSKFQVTIPKEARQKLGLKANDRVNFEASKDKIVLRRVPTLEEVSAKMDAIFKATVRKPVTDEQMKNARYEFYKKGMKW